MCCGRSNVVPLESLCIERGKSAFVVYLDLVCLNYDGGVLDAAVLACVGALKSRASCLERHRMSHDTRTDGSGDRCSSSTVTLPRAEFDVDSGETICEPVTAECPGTRIPLGSLPCAVSFGYFNG